MKIKQRWCRQHQLFNQSINQSILLWLFDTSPLAARLVGFFEDNSSASLLSRFWQKPKLEATIALKNTYSALVKQVSLYCKGGSIDGGFT